MKKRVLALILTFSMVFTMLNTAFAASPSEFTDLPTDWSRGAIERAIENGLLSGANGKINPSAQLTRAELAAIVVRAFGTTETASLSGFSDVDSSDWYYDALQKAVAMGILSGNNGKLNPNAPITREEVCVVMHKAFLLQDGGNAAQRFSDAVSISDWAQEAVAAMAAKGYLTGDSAGNVNGSKTITRAEFAQLMDNLVKGYPTGAQGGVIEGNAVMKAGQSLSGVTVKGDLILADGLGRNDVDLSNCTVEGRIIVRGGNEVKFSGTTRAGGGVAAAASAVLTNNTGSKLPSVSIEGANVNVTLSGTFGTVAVKADNVTVQAAKDAKVDTVEIAASGTTVEGNGEVAAVDVKTGASDTKVTTNHTDITVDAGGGKVTSSNGSLSAGESGTTDDAGRLEADQKQPEQDKPSGTGAVTKPSGSDSSSGGSSGGSSHRPSRPTYYEVTDETGKTIGSFARGTVLTIDPSNGEDPYVVTVQGAAALETPSREGYTFAGWSVSGTTITAQWTKDDVPAGEVLVKDSNGGTVGSFEIGTVVTVKPENGEDEYTVTIGADTVIAVPTWAEHNFVNWEVDDNVITALWEAVSAEDVLVKDSSGGTVGIFKIGTVVTVRPENGEDEYTVTIGADTVIAVPTWAEHNFVNWEVDNNVITALWEAVPAEDVLVKDSAGREIGTFETGSVLTIDNGDGSPATTVTVSANTVIPVPEREGYTFQLWAVEGNTVTAQWKKNPVPVSETAVYGANADVVVWNAADALNNTTYASHTNGKGVSAETGTDFAWTAAEDGKSIQLLAADGSNPDTDNEWSGTTAEDLAKTPSLTYKVNVATAGAYHLSFFSNSPNEKSDAFHIGLNGEYAFTTKDKISNGSDDYGSAAGERWFVCNLGTITLEEGENTINIWARESGVLLRQFYLSRQNPIFLKKGWLDVPERVDGLIDLTVDHQVEVDFGGSGSASVSAAASNSKPVTYTVVSDHPEIAAAAVSGSSVAITAKSYGRAALTVTASADGCADVIDVISVIVKDKTTGTADAGAPVDLMMAPAAATKDSITIVWDKPGGREGNLEDYEDVTGYNVYQGSTKIGETGPKVTHFTAEDLDADTEYTFYVTAVREDDEAKSVVLTARTRKDGGTIDVTEAPYNAKGDGTTKDTLAIQSAIDACPENGTVLLPADHTFLTGALDLKRNMTFQVDGTLKASNDPNDFTAKPENYPAGHVITDLTNDDDLVLTRYEGWELYCYRSLLNVGHINRSNRREVTCENVTICGTGVIQGDRSLSGSMRPLYNQEYDKGSYTERRYPEYRSDGSNGRRLRGRLINMRQAKNVNFTGVTLRDGFCWNVHMVYCDTITTHGVTWDMGGGDNLDGWDPDSTRNSMIFGCDLKTGDDCIAIKSGKNYDGNIVNMPTENIRIFDLEMGGGHGMAIGSEQSGGVENIYIRDLNVHDTSYGFELKANKVRGGYIKNVTLLDCTYNQFLAHSVSYNADGDPAPDLPVFSDITIKNSVIANKSEKAIELIGFRDDAKGTYAPLANVLFENVVVGLDQPGKNVDKYINIGDAKNIVFKNVTLTSGAPVRLSTFGTVEELNMTNDLPEFTKEIEAESMNTAAEKHDAYRMVYDTNASGEQVASLQSGDSDSLSAKYVGSDAEMLTVTYYDDSNVTYKLFMNNEQIDTWTSTGSGSLATHDIAQTITANAEIRLEVSKTGSSKARIDKIRVSAKPTAANDVHIKLDDEVVKTNAFTVMWEGSALTVEGLLDRISPNDSASKQTYAVYANAEDAVKGKNALDDSTELPSSSVLVVTSQDETETALYQVTSVNKEDAVKAYSPNDDGNIIINAADAIVNKPYASIKEGSSGGKAYEWKLITSGEKTEGMQVRLKGDDTADLDKITSINDNKWAEGGDAAGAPSITFKVYAPQAGKYYLNVYSRAGEGNGSFHVFLNGQHKWKVGKDTGIFTNEGSWGNLTGDQWFYGAQGKELELQQGENTITCAGRKIGFLLRQIMLSTEQQTSLTDWQTACEAAEPSNVSQKAKKVTMPKLDELELGALDDVEITVDDTEEVILEVTADEDAEYQLEVTSDDEETVIAELEDGIITLTGIQAGSTDITVTIISDDEVVDEQTFTVTVHPLPEEDDDLAEQDSEDDGTGSNEPENPASPEGSDENLIPEE